MIEDLEGQEGVQWSADFGLKEGEILPDDVEELTQAQYTTWKFLAVMQGYVNEDEVEADKQKKAISDSPSNLMLPFRQKLDS